MASKLRIKVNGLVHNVTASLDTPLLYVLHNELHLHGPRFGCGLAQCGACSVLLDGKEIRSCVTPVAAVSGKAITTLEGMPALYAKSRGTTAAAPDASSASGGVDRIAGPAVRLLPERDADPGCRSAGDDEASDQGADQDRHERAPLSLWHLPRDHGGHSARSQVDGEGSEMTANDNTNRDVFGATLSRATFVKGTGALVVALSMSGVAVGSAAAAKNEVDAATLEGWLTINADNTITIRTGKFEFGQGSASAAYAQIVAEELNVPYSAITSVIMGDTDRTPDGGIGAGFLGRRRDQPQEGRRVHLPGLARARLDPARRACRRTSRSRTASSPAAASP